MFVQLWMTTDLITIDPDQNLAEADNLLQRHNIRRLPVLQNRQLVGILTPANISNGLPSITDPENAANRDAIAASTPVRSMMTCNPITIGPDDTLEQAASLMRKHKIGGLPVVKDGRLAGIISESNVLDALLEVLGTCEHCARIELKIEKNPDAFYELLDTLKEYRMDVLSIVVLRNFSLEHKLVTLRVNGSELDEMIDELWESGFQVTRILREDKGE